MNSSLKNELKNKMRWYVANSTFQSFVDDLGWEEWMNDFTDAEDSVVITEREGQKINDFLSEIWREMVDE